MDGKRLITESDVRAMARGAELVITPDTIATPAALDAAFERGLRVVRGAPAQSAPDGGGCGCGGPSECTWRRMRSADGVYVVVVRSGVATVTRLTEQGPAPLAGA